MGGVEGEGRGGRPPVTASSSSHAAGAGGGRESLASSSHSFGIGSGVFDPAAPKIRVVVRKRPLSKKESKGRELDVVQTVSDQTLLVHEPKQKVDLTRYTETHDFTFDEVFDVDVSTEEVYRHTAQKLIAGIFKGVNATCFAYGQTGSGKTFTMMGDTKEGRMIAADGRLMVGRNAGLYVLAARDIFAYLRSKEDRSGMEEDRLPKGAEKLLVYVSFYEIYGGKLYDLLNNRNVLIALEDGQQNVVIKALSEQRVRSVEELLACIDSGNAVRSTGSTGANADSSRSHAVLQVRHMQPHECTSLHEECMNDVPCRLNNVPAFINTFVCAWSWSWPRSQACL